MSQGIKGTKCKGKKIGKLDFIKTKNLCSIKYTKKMKMQATNQNICNTYIKQKICIPKKTINTHQQQSGKPIFKMGKDIPPWKRY